MHCTLVHSFHFVLHVKWILNQTEIKNWMLGAAVCCTALWENFILLRVFHHKISFSYLHVLFQELIFTHFRECCWLWDAVPSISKWNKETWWLVNILTLSNPLQLYFENFLIYMTLASYCVIKRIFTVTRICLGHSKKIVLLICNIAAGKCICFASILNLKK